MKQVWVVYVRGTNSLIEILACFVPSPSWVTVVNTPVCCSHVSLPRLLYHYLRGVCGCLGRCHPMQDEGSSQFYLSFLVFPCHQALLDVLQPGGVICSYNWPPVTLTVLHEFLEMGEHYGSDSGRFFAHHCNIPINKGHGRNVFIDYGLCSGGVEDLVGPCEGFYYYSVSRSKLTTYSVFGSSDHHLRMVILVRILICSWEIASWHFPESISYPGPHRNF